MADQPIPIIDAKTQRDLQQAQQNQILDMLRQQQIILTGDLVTGILEKMTMGRDNKLDLPMGLQVLKNILVGTCVRMGMSFEDFRYDLSKDWLVRAEVQQKREKEESRAYKVQRDEIEQRTREAIAAAGGTQAMIEAIVKVLFIRPVATLPGGTDGEGSVAKQAAPGDAPAVESEAKPTLN